MKKTCLIFFILVLFISCDGEINVTEESKALPPIFPDYTNITVPPNIAPLNFRIEGTAVAEFSHEEYCFRVRSNAGLISIPRNKWKQIITHAKGDKLSIHIIRKTDHGGVRYAPFYIHVAPEEIDPYIAYRLIEPGYAVWNEMGIYQRELSSYNESAIYENKLTKNNCVNCHTFCANNPSTLLFHMRGGYAGTVLIKNENIEIIKSDPEKGIPSFVYPYWHPSGRFIAFSTNKTVQDFHPTQRVEVFDNSSDVFVYNLEKKQILTTSFLYSKDNFETFPSFSADGKTLYYCTTPSKSVPDSINKLKYSLCSISFDTETGSFGNMPDTLFNAEITDKSLSFPRMSPDGKYLLCTVSAYGTFPIWHKDADLYLINAATKQGRYLQNFNSEETDSYHSWSSNSRWVIFSSRRTDGLYTRPFIGYLSPEGKEGKPFLLPQKDPQYYTFLLKSFNIPEFIKDKVEVSSFRIMEKVKNQTDKKVAGNISVN